MNSLSVVYRRIRRDTAGSLTAEAVLLLPVIFALIAVFSRLGLFLRDTISDSSESRPSVRWEDSAGNQAVAPGYVGEADGRGSAGSDSGIGFLTGSLPARRIRDADLIIDIGYKLKEKIPAWFDN